MPICTRAGLDKRAEPVENFQDNEKVFFCELTREIFRDYEDYFQRVMLLNSTIWSCAETGKQNLTYAEALKSERRVRKTGENLGEWLKAPTLMLVDEQKQTSFRMLLSKIFAFLKDRLFYSEEVLATKTKHNYVPCKVIEIITPKEIPIDGVYDPKTVKYKVQKLRSPPDMWVTGIAQTRRKRNNLNLETLRVFLKEHAIITENSIRVKPESYEKYVSGKNLGFDSVFVGNMPKWEPGKKFGKGLVQSSMGNYVVHDADNSQKELESLKETMERMRREKEERLAEQERKRVELVAKIEEELGNILRKSDDLMRNDQKIMPVYKPVRTIVASKYFSEFLMIQEFLHSFAPILSASDVFRTNITFQQMCRAFLFREVAGPLSDILQVLLSTIFALQIEENNDCPIQYMKNKREGFLWKVANTAVDAHKYVRNFLSQNLFELPIDAQTLTEILRLHFLSSGAANGEKLESYRYQYRNGYSVIEDPGLLLRIQYPHILRALKMYTVYQLPFKDILKILNCLINQILTYNATIGCLEERHENLSKVRHNIRMLIARENKRVQQLQMTRKTITTDYWSQTMENKDNEEKKAELERAMTKKLKDLEEQDGREKGNFEYELNEMNAEMFNYLTLLGTDRAYRNYYVFEALPGLFVEHPSEEVGPCLEDPPKNDHSLALIPKERYKLKTFLLNRYKQNDKENMKKTKEIALFTPPTLVNGEVIKINGSTTDSVVSEKELTPVDLFMCSGDIKNCIVHDPSHPTRNKWSYIHTKEELDALIESLNSFGIRESVLKETLIKVKQNILPHLTKCPIQILNIDISEREQSISQMLNETQKKYANSNFGFAENADINEVMHATLVRQILEFELEITDGNLGRMKVANLEQWREDLSIGKYNSQCKKLKYGPDTVNGDAVAFTDPGNNLGDTFDIESEDSSDEGISLHDSLAIRQNVSNLASALLQIEQSIEGKFLKEPFGVKVEIKDRKDMETKMSAGKSKLRQWESSLMNSTSYSQIFLHLNILSDAVKWNKSSMKSSCLICRRKGDADKLLLCDECNAGTHMFCMKPKMKKIPEGNWYCFRCELKLGIGKPDEKQKKKVRKVFSMEEDDEEKYNKKTVDYSESDDEPLNVGKNKKSQPTINKKKGRKVVSESEGNEFDSSSSDDEPLFAIKNKKPTTKKTVKVVSSESASADDDENGDNDSTSASDNIPLKVAVKTSSRPRQQVNGRRENDAAVSVSSDDDDEDNKPLIANGHLKRNLGKFNAKNSTEFSADYNGELEDIDMELDVCQRCSSDETDLSCNACKKCYHSECIGLRRIPRSWLCSTCKSQAAKKRKIVESELESSNDDTDYNESFHTSRGKRQRHSHNRDVHNSASNDDLSKNNNNSRRGRRTDEILKLDTIALYDLLDQIMKHEDAWPFLRPVSQSEVPDYHKIIKNPMDFARIKSNLNMCRYSTNEDVLGDIELVFRNCDTYNSQGNDIYRAGASLEQFVAKKCQELNLKFTPSDMVMDA